MLADNTGAEMAKHIKIPAEMFTHYKVCHKQWVQDPFDPISDVAIANFNVNNSI